LLLGHLVEGRVRETAGFSVEQFSLIRRQRATGHSFHEDRAEQYEEPSYDLIKGADEGLY
jgi:hypothetical protein